LVFVINKMLVSLRAMSSSRPMLFSDAINQLTKYMACEWAKRQNKEQL